MEPWALVASQSTVLHRCIEPSHATVGAGAVVTNRTEVPTFAMALGVPARIEPDRVEEFGHRVSTVTSNSGDGCSTNPGVSDDGPLAIVTMRAVEPTP